MTSTEIEGNGVRREWKGDRKCPYLADKQREGGGQIIKNHADVTNKWKLPHGAGAGVVMAALAVGHSMP